LASKAPDSSGNSTCYAPADWWSEDASDRRAKTLHLTVEGRRVALKVEASFAQLRSELLTDISNEDIAACLRIFTLLEMRMSERSDPDRSAA
jgi:MarR family transcriptional regulator, transcriptional regulator for hemolysin